MKQETAGAAALVLGSLAGIGLMMVHPSHGGGAPIVGHFTLNDLVHATALVANPVLTFGFWTLTRALGARPLPVLAFSFFLFGAVAVLIAATISGMVTPAAMAAAHSGVDSDVFAKVAHLSVWLNRGFANAHVALFSIAYALYALAWPVRSLSGQAIRALGLFAGLGILVWQLSGTFRIDVHSMIVVVTSQGLWVIAAAFAMTRGLETEK